MLEGDEKRMGSYLKDHQLNIDCYAKILYANLMITTYQNLPINMQRIKRKKSKYITKENQHTTKERKTRKDQRK